MAVSTFRATSEVAAPDVVVAPNLDTTLAKGFVGAFAFALFFMPNALLPQSRILATGLLAGLLLCLMPARLSRTALGFLLMSIAAAAQILMSVIVNVGPHQALGDALLVSLRPIYFAFIYLAGYMCVSASGLKADGFRVRGLLTRVASFFILAQFLLALMQAVGIADVLDVLYAQGKARDASTLVRATGTIGNPNALAFFTLQCFLLILIVGTLSGLRKAFILACGAALIVLTGSRSVLLVFLLCLILFVFLRRKSLTAWVAYAAMAILAMAAAYLVVSTYAEYFRYLAQLQVLLENTDAPLRKISSMAARFEHWDSSLRLFREQPGVSKYIFGLGGRAEYSVLDNDYLFISLRHGFTGIVLFYGMYLVLMSRYLSRSTESATRFFGLLVLVATGVLAFAADVFSAWQTMAFFLFASGCLSAIQPSMSDFLRTRAILKDALT